MRRKAFTLVELLVVIGIIALLMGILLPVLATVREAGRNAVCLSNLRQVHSAMLFYAEENNGQIPIGYRRSKQFNSMIYSSTTDTFVLFGKLHEAGFTDNGGTFFCPSEQRPNFLWDVPENPWPPGETDKNTFSGYACRPLVELPDVFTSTTQVPRLSRLGNIAILADVMNSPDRLDTRHVDWVNVADAGGSVRRFERGRFPAEFPYLTLDERGDRVELGDFTGGGFEQLPPPVGFPPDPSWDDEQDAIWAAFDHG